MLRNYALTITQSSGNRSISNYERALDKYASFWGVAIVDRCYETGKVAKRLHVHALVQQDYAQPIITFDAFRDSIQKNHRTCLDFGIVRSDKGWTHYRNKEKPVINLFQKGEGSLAIPSLQPNSYTDERETTRERTFYNKWRRVNLFKKT